MYNIELRKQDDNSLVAEFKCAHVPNTGEIIELHENIGTATFKINLIRRIIQPKGKITIKAYGESTTIGEELFKL